ncbi:MAG: hypothetical protein EPO11_01115 [Gammaproteobacteria bacterium]|nr:MAG: hypothetical protein EPO11_01115 [Gammaproteobacteria bacterium]
MHREKIMVNKIRVSFFLPENLQQEVKEQMIKEGYDLKGKSRWITEAIERLFLIKTYPDLVKINDEMEGLGKLDSISIARKLKYRLDEAVINIRKAYPAIEGVQSRIVRTAIVQRLLRGDEFSY